MKKLFAIAQVCSLVFFAACAAEDIDAPADPAEVVGEPVAAPPEDAPADALPEAGARAGCAYVQYCNSPDPYWGTLCVRTGCTEAQAWAECRTDARYVCGRIVPQLGMYL